MKTFYKRISRRLIMTTLILVSCVFLTSLSFGPEEVTDKAPQPVESETATQTPEPTVSAPETQETPQDGAVIDHPLPEDPILTNGPWASAHFRMDEYACDCASYCDGWPAEMDPELLEKIEALRCAFDRPIIITSGVRCERRNAEVGGIENSWHLTGHAADLYCPGVPYDEVAAVARTLGLGVIEYPYQQFDHVEIWR